MLITDTYSEALVPFVIYNCMLFSWTVAVFECTFLERAKVFHRAVPSESMDTSYGLSDKQLFKLGIHLFQLLSPPSLKLQTDIAFMPPYTFLWWHKAKANRRSRSFFSAANAHICG